VPHPGTLDTHWHASCSASSPMYLKEAVAECCSIQQQVVSLYTCLASMHSGDANVAQLWRELERDEMRRAMLLGALEGLLECEAFDGPFIVAMRQRLSRVHRAVDRFHARVSAGIEPGDALDLATFLAGGELPHVLDDIMELAAPTLVELVAIAERELECSAACDHLSRIRVARSRLAHGRAHAVDSYKSD